MNKVSGYVWLGTYTVINKADFQSLIKNVLITNQAQGLYMYLSLLVTATIEILPCT